MFQDNLKNPSAKMVTERLVLEPITQKDVGFILNLLNTEEWLKYIGDRNVHTLLDAQRYIEEVRRSPERSYWTVFLKDYLTPIGVVTFMKRDFLDMPDIGFAFLPEFHKLGYAFEATMAVLSHLNNLKGGKRICAMTLPQNVKSIKLIEKVGLQFERFIEEDGERMSLYSGTIN